MSVALPTMLRRDCVAEFLDVGFVSVPVDRGLINETTAASRSFITQAKSSGQHWSLMRPGEEVEGPDVGLIDTRQNVGKDYKFFCHFAPDLRELAFCQGLTIDGEFDEALRTLERGYTHISDTIVHFGAVLEERAGHLLLPDFAKRLRQSIKMNRPFCTTSLRGLLYPDVPNQTGAQDHVDRGTLTGHCGDKGGELYCYKQQLGERLVISPPEGYMVIFAGVKILWESKGVLKPLEHGSTNQSGVVREALVMFAHTEVGYQVRSSKQALRECPYL